MEPRCQEISWDMKKIIVIFFLNGEEVSVIARSANRSLPSVYWVIGKLQWTVSLENLRKLDRPRHIGDRECWRVQEIVNKDCLAPLGVCENKPTTVSRKIIKLWLKENGLYRGVFKGKKWSKRSTERNWSLVVV